MVFEFVKVCACVVVVRMQRVNVLVAIVKKKNARVCEMRAYLQRRGQDRGWPLWARQALSLMKQVRVRGA